MITLFKMGFELLLTAAVFAGGVKFAVHFPTWAAKIDAFLSLPKKAA